MQRKSLSLLAAAATVLGTAAASPVAAAPPRSSVSAAPAAAPAVAAAVANDPRWFLPSAPAVSTTVAPGVTLTTMTYGEQDADDRWTVHVYLPATPDGPLATAGTALGPRATADQVATALRAKGFEPRVEEVESPAFADHRPGTLGWTVRIGRHAELADATAELSRVKAAGFAGGTRYTAQDGTDRHAPQKVHALKLDFRTFKGSVATNFGPTLNGTEKLTDLIASSGAIAGINGQWFYNQAPGGLYVKDGKLLGSATQGRAGLKVTKGGRAFDVDTFTAHVTLRAGSESVEVDGVNRIPGDVWNCGGVGGDQPTQEPQHDLKCTDSSELVRFTPEWGKPPAGAGAEAVLDSTGRVTAVNASRGASVPAGGSTLQAIGDSAQWLLEHAVVGETLTFTEQVKDGLGRVVPLTADTTILQVGPTLVQDGRVSVNAQRDGIIREGTDQTFTYNWTLRSNPRSMVGVDDRGRLMLVVVDGRQAGYSEGLGIAETAQLMRQLGAQEAMNLDGGGSSVLATSRGGIVNRPSDATGQRSLGNVLLVRP
ncbi:phosphodiester glycosidase family protein [Streptomyces sp. P9(2023)]|uniref:phosphodiester glycosidase family protein n=1 Tax=Streptomyces sp. P9(2023) TaxID=3064394 RepID=UPI0028F43FE2|nr:phosphodiester glycosidase family protein [Streptomyces sp. P9(2023)]MDT9690060.1 phosphodiester glycosidase family protein [Streptomyces sp. P9(2023)]